MGKARGPRRKQAPARSNRVLGNSNSSLVSKSVRRQKNAKGEGHFAGGPNGGTATTMRTASQQLPTANKRSRGGKRRRKKGGEDAQPKRSSEAAAIQAEYAAVDARAKARQISEDTARSRGASRIRLAPATANLSMPSQGRDATTQGSGGVPSSVKMVEALLHSISDDPAIKAAPARPVRAAPRKRKGNPYAALEEESDGEEMGVRSKQVPNAVGSRRDVGESSTGQALAFVAPRGFSGISMSGGGGVGVATGAPSRGTASSVLQHDDEDPDL